MNDRNHTPTPWAIGEANNIDNRDSHIGIRDLESDWVVAEVQCDVDSLPGDANASFIVRAVNSHAELVKALHNLEVSANTVRYCYDKRPENFASSLMQLEEDCEHARAALTAAGEQP